MSEWQHNCNCNAINEFSTVTCYITAILKKVITAKIYCIAVQLQQHTWQLNWPSYDLIWALWEVWGNQLITCRNTGSNDTQPSWTGWGRSIKRRVQLWENKPFELACIWPPAGCHRNIELSGNWSVEVLRFTGSTFPVSISYYRSCQLLARLLLWKICRKWFSDYLWLGLQRFHLQKKLRYGNEAQVINYHWFLLLWKQQHRKPEWRLLSIFFFFTVSL